MDIETASIQEIGHHIGLPPIEVNIAGMPPELLALAASCKKDLQALKEYRALTGATLDEARSWLRSVQAGGVSRRALAGGGGLGRPPLLALVR
jgi:hypothetical protein